MGTWDRLGDVGTGSGGSYFSFTLSGDGNFLAARVNDKVYVYKFDQDSKTWDFHSSIPIDEEGGYGLDKIYLALSHDGNLIVVGNPDNDNNYPNGNMNLGAVITYVYRNGNWRGIGGILRGTENYAEHGSNLSLTPDGLALAFAGSMDIFL